MRRRSLGSRDSRPGHGIPQPEDGGVIKLAAATAETVSAWPMAAPPPRLKNPGMAIALRIRPSGQTELEHPEPVLVPVAIDPVRVVADVNAELAKLAGDPAQAAAEVFVTTPAVPAAE